MKWPDGTVQGVHIGIESGQAFVPINFRGITLDVFLRTYGLEAERD